MKNSNDIKHFNLLKQGCPSAFAAIYAKYHRRIYWIGRGLMKDSFVVETLVQDTFLKLWVNRESIESAQHMVNFLRFVMTRECNTFYSRPKNKFLRNIYALDDDENYQDYRAGYDPLVDEKSLQDQESAQLDFDQVNKILPVLNADRKHLIELCLKYDFRYKAIADVMGISITKTSNEVKLAIRDLKTILNQEAVLKTKEKSTSNQHVPAELTREQARVLSLRCEKQYSFAAIASELNLSQKEVHRAFTTAYKFLQDKHRQQQPQSA
ncbi:RNA polymerase sigma factor [Leeuwenhoekiella sp. A16]|uniref:RNA polymerase sigma factor n=1 Tax=unclassified Leeuwenhoekiella TaxID=2615029 RepID=UPI003A807ECB